MGEALLLKVEEAARRLSLGRSLTYRLLQTGELPSIRVAGARRVLASDLEAFVARLREGQVDEG